MNIFNRLANEYRESNTYLFADKSFYKKLWVLPLLLLFPFIKYPFGIIFIKGWQVQMVADLARDKPLQSLHFGNIFLKGLQVTAVTLLYFSVPTILCYALGLKGIIGFFLDIWELITGGLEGYLTSYIQNYILSFVIYGIWGLICNPLIQCSIIRYAISGNWRDLFHLPKNFFFLIRNWHQFIKFYFFYLVTLGLLMIIDSIIFIIAFPIELILAPFLLVLYYGSVSHELGHLAQKFCYERYEPELSLEVKESEQPILLINTNKESTMATETSLFTYFIEGYTKNYVNFNGRARKREYWGFTLFNTLISIILLMVGATGVGAIPALIIALAMMPPSIAISVRRLHDANKSGWFALGFLIMLIPVIGEIIGMILTVVIGVLEGTKGENQYGEDPLKQNTLE
ncbi:DUF805 domain-containing protein [Pasteurella multocida]